MSKLKVPEMTKMTKQRFKEIVSSYGAEKKRWPTAELASMLTFVEENPSAQKLLNPATSIDNLLSQLPQPKAATTDFIERLSQIPQPQAKTSARSWILQAVLEQLSAISLQGFMPRAVGLASVCAVGIMLGMSDIARFDNTVTTVDAGNLIFSSPGLERELGEID